MQLIDLYYQAYQNYIKQTAKPANKEIPEDSMSKMSRQIKKKGKSYAVLWISFLVISILLGIFLVLNLFSNSTECIQGCMILFLLYFIIIRCLDRADKKYIQENYRKMYSEHVKYAIGFKEKLAEDFNFTRIQQFEMIGQNAAAREEQMRSSINRKRESAERFFWGIIIASAIAIVPAIITGMLDNSDKIEKTVQMVNKIVLGVVVFLALCFIIYQFIKREIQRRERKKRS
ncbi:MAG: hypothetical protein IKG82_02920, partial [Oscillospiraceae bacterium]|nr:hypothetical protein [Oscillospiraceae bacterium]